MKEYFNVELAREIAQRFKEVLRDMHCKFESSECFDKIHFEVLVEPESETYNTINNWLEREV